MAKIAGNQKYREYTFPDGYTYRQFKDGDILIVASPHGGAGTLVTQDGPTSKAWQAITDQIKAKKEGNAQAGIAAGIAVTNILVATLTPRQKRKHRMVDIPPPPPPTPDIPWLAIGLGFAGVGTLFALGRGH